MKTYRHLFFDLDHTLWDFAKNSRAAIAELYERHGLKERGISSFQVFYDSYVVINDRFWSLYRAGKMSKRVLRTIRFSTTLQKFGVVDELLGEKFSDDYIELSPYQTALFPDCHETLDHLKEKGYQMHIITNGFDEVQHIKLRESDLTKYFDQIITSETVQARKPNPLIFEHAFKMSNARAAESLMIGDSLEADIKGAMDCDMDAVYFNPSGKAHDVPVTYEIKGLKELRQIL